MAATDNDHIEAGVHLKILQDVGLVANAGLTVKNAVRRSFLAVFHVKHAPPEHFDVVVNVSFTNTKIAKDDVQNILDIDSASESAKRRRGRA
jgi:hypothetical protein